MKMRNAIGKRILVIVALFAWAGAGAAVGACVIGGLDPVGEFGVEGF